MLQTTSTPLLRTTLFFFGLALSAGTHAQFAGGYGSGATVSSFSGSAALPLTLLSFDAAIADRDVTIDWTTINELNTDHFLVERTADGSGFVEIGRLDAAGTSAPGVEVVYTLTDDNPSYGAAHYRLKAVDIDGTFSYSELVPVHFGEGGSELSFAISPNPSSGKMIGLDLNSVSANREISLDVIDAAGRKLVSRKLTARSGQHLEVRLRDRLPVGTYLLRISQTGTGSRTERLIVGSAR